MARRSVPQSANELTKALLVRLPQAVPGLRCWRANTGGAYPIATIAPVKAALIRGDAKLALELITRAQPLRFGIPGLPDIDGILPDGRRLGVEVKWGKDRQSEEQAVCQEVFTKRGAVYVIARELEEAVGDVVRYSKDPRGACV